MEIVNVKDKRVKKLVTKPRLSSVKGFEPKVAQRVSDMISAIRAATHPLQLLSVPAWKAHELKPGYPDKWSLTVTPNYRLTFYFDAETQEARDLDYEDYH